MVPQDTKDVAQAIARDLTGIAGEIAALKGTLPDGSLGRSTSRCVTTWRPRTPPRRPRWWKQGAG